MPWMVLKTSSSVSGVSYFKQVADTIRFDI